MRFWFHWKGLDLQMCLLIFLARFDQKLAEKLAKFDQKSRFLDLGVCTGCIFWTKRRTNAILVSLERSRLADVPFDIFGQIRPKIGREIGEIRPKIEFLDLGVCTGCIFWTERRTNAILVSLERSRLADVPFDIFGQIRPQIGREIGEIRPKIEFFYNWSLYRPYLLNEGEYEHDFGFIAKV